MMHGRLTWFINFPSGIEILQKKSLKGKIVPVMLNKNIAEPR